VDPAFIAQQVTDILAPALSALRIAGKTVADKGKEVPGNLDYYTVRWLSQ
jgi:hypothetical protein